ncbi:PilZ domain-containing protein [Paraferrimonas sedimenticola]|uniref:Pilus assembly protein PilZ n=1 Tax=Paraferrimonas sedimenticola TaxID=375674 RepID=A0AA37W2S5_9GAMM|nr:PilZ domain-containing protein [Paraferrimonas sedimenticola]GLP98083.1 pilus assembly protein PilZ [Paraferrimonas sedimenticola]
MAELLANFETVEHLYRAYMPFISPAGLFITTRESYQMEQKVSIAYRLPGSATTHEFQGTVCWINPLGAQGGRPQGIGVRIDSDVELHKSQIENLLAAKLSSGELTSTI